MARGEIRKLYDEGKISGREYSRAARGVCGSNEINDPAYQSSAGNFGPNDAGHIDASANRREFPKESVLKGKAQNTVPVGRSANTKGWPTEAEVRRMSANEWKSDWY
jgi:hypothetical protein